MADADSPLTWTADGQPRSGLYGDVYFSAQDGLAESRAVFLQGCGLPEAWAGRSRFVVGELGFGTGLNIAALLQLWNQCGPPGGRLHIFSVEAHPLSADEASRALSLWPELAPLAHLLTSRWPGRAPGLHRVDLPEYAATLDVFIGDVDDALEGWSGRADAWFLDGFSPALNPAMWRDEVLALVGARAAPGARAATFTVAGQVRRGLAAAGFTVDKRPGFGRKRERLEAVLPGVATDPGQRRVAVIGAGIAGAATARALRAVGSHITVFDAEGAGAGGSGFPAALATPRLDAGLGPPARLFAQAFTRAIQLYEILPDAVIARGVLQLAHGDRDPARFATVAGSGLFASGSLATITAATATERLGEPAPEALDQTTALVLRPATVLAAWAGDIKRARVDGLEHDGVDWGLFDAEGREIARADAVIVTAAMGTAGLAPGIALAPVRGQASWIVDPALTTPAAAWGGYVLPTGDGLLFGATHDRGDLAIEVRGEDHARNRATLAAVLPALAARVGDAPLQGRAAIRATTRDRMPLAGPVGEGLFVLTGLGSRGFSLAPLLAEHVAALALGAPSPLAADLAALVAPGRRSAKVQLGSGS